jgi:hypothetical protein
MSACAPSDIGVLLDRVAHSVAGLLVMNNTSTSTYKEVTLRHRATGARHGEGKGAKCQAASARTEL